MSLTRPIDIIVPIYNARLDVMRCVESVLRHARGEFQLVLVDDCSTDQELVRFLRESAESQPRVTLLRPEKNGGFVQSANFGMQHSLAESTRTSSPRDVLLLNSDTIVTPEFLERIQACVYADDSTGIVSPFSNNATICSIPKFCQDNELPKHLSIDEYARIISRYSAKERPEIVTAVGFCMYIRKEVLDRVGLFDSIYGRGFGEENDLCEQAKRCGYKIRLADDVFVAHTGKASFGAEGTALEKTNIKTLLERFPQYLEDVSRFCETNPLRNSQLIANYFTKRAHDLEYSAILHVIHSDPFQQGAGGSEHYALDLIQAQAAPRAIVVYPVAGGITAAEIIRGCVDQPLRHFFPVKEMPGKICYQNDEISALLNELIDLFGISFAHLHHLFFWPIGIWKVFGNRGVPYVYTVHDYLAACPSHNLFNYDTMSCCGCSLNPDTTACCLQAYSQTAQTQLPGQTSADVVAHREHFRGLLHRASAVIAPSKKALSLVSERTEAEISGVVIEHGYDAPSNLPRLGAVASGPLKVAVLGNVNYPNKGAANYAEVVKLTRDVEIDWHFFGDTAAFGYHQQLQTAGNAERIFFHGPYQRGEIFDKLREQEIQLTVMLPACHETFSYTLSESLLAGIPVLALSIGSLEERLQNAGLSDCLCSSPAQVVERLLYFLAYRAELGALQTRVAGFRHRTKAECAAEVLATYERAGAALFSKGTLLSEDAQRETFTAHKRAETRDQLPTGPTLSQNDFRPEWLKKAGGRFGKLARYTDRYFRDLCLRQRVRVIESFPVRKLARACSLSADTQLLGFRSRVARFKASGRDPYLVFPEKTIPTDSVDCVRLRIRCETHRAPRAQLFFVHEHGEAFSEAKSFHIPLVQTGEWQDVLVDLRTWHALQTWLCRPSVTGLRLDPLDCEGYFELEDLTLAKFSDSSTQPRES
ncbi:MAG: glycosyltransferase [Bdellovibrionota bacterium]